jgi:hypothetical protein
MRDFFLKKYYWSLIHLKQKDIIGHSYMTRTSVYFNSRESSKNSLGLHDALSLSYSLGFFGWQLQREQLGGVRISCSRFLVGNGCFMYLMTDISLWFNCFCYVFTSNNVSLLQFWGREFNSYFCLFVCSPNIFDWVIYHIFFCCW